MIEVVRAGPQTTVQDLGRPGYAHLGVPRSGALDVPALRLANALVGNPASAAVLETTLMGCALRFSVAARVAVTGAAALVRVDGVEVSEVIEMSGVIEVSAGARLDVGRATAGVRSYVAVAGGIAVDPVLGSRSTDTLSGLGPPRVTDGMWLPVGSGTVSPEVVATEPLLPPDRTRLPVGSGTVSLAAPVTEPLRSADGPRPSEARSGNEPGPPPAGGHARLPVRELVLGVRLGPRDDWFAAAELFGAAYTISPVGNRVGARLAGPALSRTKAGELPPEGVVLGAIQVPADGQPLIFLADHPTTGGYPVIGMVDDVTPLAQARPGTTVRFRDLD